MGRPSFAAGFLLLACLILGVFPVQAEPNGDGVERYELENGLKVRLRPVAGAKDVAVLVLYDIGEADDPKGQSGLAHLVEHCYVTSAAGETEARTAEAMMAAYPNAWNAQTGSDYTVIAFVAPKDRMEAELAEAAARMRNLRVTKEDLAREKPRMYDELRNMYYNVPMLATVNGARAAVLPQAPGARKGGVEIQISGLALGSVLARLRAYYKPGNARLVLAGGFEVAEGRALVEQHFASIPRGEPLPTPRAVVVEGMRDCQIDVVGSGGPHPSPPAYVCLARVAPAPDSPAYPPFLLLLRRLFQAQGTATAQGPKVFYGLVDAPEILFLHASVLPTSTPDEAIARIQTVLDEVGARALTPIERFQTAQAFAHLLGTFPVPAAMLGNNPYGVAFGVGRREQMGIDGKRLGERLNKVTDAEMKLAAESIFSRANGVDLVARPAPTAKPAR